MEITFDNVKDILPSGLKLILDKTYQSPPREDLDIFLAGLRSNMQPFDYRPESHDCDNAAWDFVTLFSGKGWPVALAIIEGHALVIVIVDGKDIVWIEPQTGQAVENTKRLKVTVMP